MTPKDTRQFPDSERLIPAICMTLCFCMAMGIALHSWAGVAVGLCMGCAFGLFDSGDNDDKAYEPEDQEQ